MYDFEMLADPARRGGLNRKWTSIFCIKLSNSTCPILCKKQNVQWWLVYQLKRNQICCLTYYALEIDLFARH